MKIKVQGFVFWEKSFVTDKSTFTIWKCKVNDDPTRVFISEQEVEIEVPDNFDPVPGMISGLKAEKQRIQAECNVKVENIEDQIQRLLAIEHKQD